MDRPFTGLTESIEGRNPKISELFTIERDLPKSIGSGHRWKMPDKKSVCPKDAVDVVAFSGGRTSGRMLRRILDSGKSPIVLFANTGRERNETLDFVHAVETEWSVPVVWLQYHRVPTTDEIVGCLKTKKMRDYAAKQAVAHWFQIVDYDSAARIGDNNLPFDELLEWMSVLPNPRVRACTSQLKIRTMQRYLWSIGVSQFINHIGFRADEPDRAYDLIYSADRDKDVRFSFPLANAGIIEADVLSWWRSASFNLQLNTYEGNCDLCFLKTLAKKRRLIRENPTSADWWQAWEEKKKPVTTGDGCRWSVGKGHGINELVRDAFELAPDDGDDEEAFDCHCTTGMSLGLDGEE